MRAVQLTQEINAAREIEFPDAPEGTEQFPSRYFNYNVRNIAPDGRMVRVSPRECATNFGAGMIANVLSSQRDLPCQVVLADRVSGMAGSFNDTEQVPYCVFWKSGDDKRNGPYTGPKVKASFLLDYFNHGYPAVYALNSAELEVKNCFIDAGILKPEDVDAAKIMSQTTEP